MDEDLIPNMAKLGFKDPPPSEQSRSSEQASEQSYEVAQQEQVTQRKQQKSASSNYLDQANERLAKSRQSFDASFNLKISEDGGQENTVNGLLQKINSQQNCIGHLVDLQDTWNKVYGDHARRTEGRMDDLSNALNGLTESLVETNANIKRNMTDQQAKQEAQNVAIDKLIALQQQQQQRRPASPLRRRPRFDDEYRRSPSRPASTELLDMPVMSGSREERFRESEIGYFDPKCSETHGKGDYVTIGDKVHYRNVWLFIDSAKSIVTTKGAALVRTNLHRCLRGDAQAWYITELSHAQRLNLHGGHNLRHWEKDLTARFKMNATEAMSLLAEDRYTVDDVRRERQVSSYVQTVIRHCNDAGFATVHQQLSWAWNHLDPGLQRDISRPTASTTVLSFIQKLEDMQSAWRRYYARDVAPPKKQWQPAITSPPPPPQQYSQPTNQGYSRGQQYGNNGYTNNRSYSNNQSFNRNQSSYSQPPPNQQFGQNRDTQPRYPSNPQPAKPLPPQQRLIKAPPPRHASWR